MANGGEPRRGQIRVRRRLNTEEKQFLGQAVRNVSLTPLAAGELHQNLRGDSLDIQVDGQRAVRDSVEDTGTQQPEDALSALRIGLGHAQTQVAQLRTGFGIALLHQVKNCLVHPGTRCTVNDKRRNTVKADLGPNPAPLDRPEVGGMNPVRTGKNLGVTIVRKQTNSRIVPATHDDVQVLQQRKTRSLQQGSRGLCTTFGTINKLLDGRFHCPQHVRWRHQSNHLQGADRLVHVLTRHAQLACIDRSQVGTSGGLGIPHIALERLVSDFKRLAQLIQNPGQGAQVRHTGNRTGPTDSVFNVHDWANSAN